MASAGGVTDTSRVTSPFRPPDLVADGVLDPELAALLWLLLEGGVPLVVTGPAAVLERSALAAGLMSLVPGRAASVVDADLDPPTTERLAAMLRSGSSFALLQSGADLGQWLRRARDIGLPEDGIRRLGVVVVAAATDHGLRCIAVHCLRPSERDHGGHVQRRPPAVLATWEGETGRYEHYAWGITPELADRVDRAQADFEDRQRDRAGLLAGFVGGAHRHADWGELSKVYLRTEPPRVPAPAREPASPSPIKGGLTDPHAH